VLLYCCLSIYAKPCPLSDEHNVCLKASYLWRFVQTLNLSTNMRAKTSADQSASEFSSLLLIIGDGLLKADHKDGHIMIPHGCSNIVHSIDELRSSGVSKVKSELQESTLALGEQYSLPGMTMSTPSVPNHCTLCRRILRYICQLTALQTRIKLDPDPNLHQNLISSSLSHTQPVQKFSSRSVHIFLRYPVHRQTNKQTKTDKPVGGHG